MLFPDYFYIFTHCTNVKLLSIMKWKSVEGRINVLHYIKRYIVGVVIIAVIIVIGFLLMYQKDEAQQKEMSFAIQKEKLQEDNNVNENADISPSELIVDIKGAVHYPGVYTLSENMRIVDVIEQAGGFTKEADEKQVNLAERIYDEMYIYIPIIGEEGQQIPTFSNDTTGKDADNKIRVNQASTEELQTLTGIGPSKAETILQYIEENGPLQEVNDLLQISGIGEKTLEKFKDEIIIP